MKAVKEKKVKNKAPREKKAGKARKAWDKGNDKVRDVLHSVAFLTW